MKNLKGSTRLGIAIWWAAYGWITYFILSLPFTSGGDPVPLWTIIIPWVLFSSFIGLVIIDGIADLCSDVNDITQGNYVAQKLMQWTKELNCHIVTVIHSNFGSDKATGHLGSTLYKKCETAINLEANTVNKGLVTVSCKMSRNTAFEDFSFMVNDYGLPKVQGAIYDILKDTKF